MCEAFQMCRVDRGRMASNGNAKARLKLFSRPRLDNDSICLAPDPHKTGFRHFRNSLSTTTDTSGTKTRSFGNRHSEHREHIADTLGTACLKFPRESDESQRGRAALTDLTWI